MSHTEVLKAFLEAVSSLEEPAHLRVGLCIEVAYQRTQGWKRCVPERRCVRVSYRVRRVRDDADPYCRTDYTGSKTVTYS